MEAGGSHHRLPRLHVVTDDGILARSGFLDDARALLQDLGSRLALHLRGPRSSGRVVFEAARALAAPAAEAGALLLVNDRVDVATAAGVGGVHLGERSLAPDDARRVWGPGRWVGASVHGVERARACGRSGADFLVAGTIFTSSSHPGEAGAGVSRIRDVAAVTDLPVIAIGGVTAGRIAEVMREGAHGVAVLGAVWHAAAGPVSGARTLLDGISNELEDR